MSPSGTDAVLARLDALVLEILGHPVDPDVNFFSAGFDSLAVTKLHTLMTSRLGVRLPVTALFRRPTLRGTAERIVAAQAAQARDEAAGRTAPPAPAGSTPDSLSTPDSPPAPDSPSAPASPPGPIPSPTPTPAPAAGGAVSRREIRARIRRGEAPR